MPFKVGNRPFACCRDRDTTSQRWHFVYATKRWNAFLKRRKKVTIDNFSKFHTRRMVESTREYLTTRELEVLLLNSFERTKHVKSRLIDKRTFVAWQDCIESSSFVESQYWKTLPLYLVLELLYWLSRHLSRVASSVCSVGRSLCHIRRNDKMPAE